MDEAKYKQWLDDNWDRLCGEFIAEEEERESAIAVDFHYWSDNKFEVEE